MPLRAGHGKGRGVPRIEVSPADELPGAVPVAPSSVPLRFRPDGAPADKETARELQRRSALARSQRTRLLRSLGLTTLAANHKFSKYEIAGEEFATKHIATLAAMHDGTCGEGPASIVKTAAIQLAASRWFYDLGKAKGDAKLLGEASRLGDASRQNLLAAYELQVREAQARRQRSPRDDSAPWFVPDQKGSAQ